MATQSPYSINLDARFPPLELIDVQALVDACQDPWYNQTLCRVNDCVVRLGVVQGEFNWHKHEKEDEFFYVVDGRFVIDLEGRTVELTPRQGFTVPKGVMHRTRASERTMILMTRGPGSCRRAVELLIHNGLTSWGLSDLFTLTLSSDQG